MSNSIAGNTILVKLVSIVMLAFSAPIFLLLKIAYVIEGWLLPENKGPMFFYYNASSAGRVIPKYKVRLIKMKYIVKGGGIREYIRGGGAAPTGQS